MNEVSGDKYETTIEQWIIIKNDRTESFEYAEQKGFNKECVLKDLASRHIIGINIIRRQILEEKDLMFDSNNLSSLDLAK